MKNNLNLLVLMMLTAHFYAVTTVCTQPATAKYNNEHFIQFRENLNLSADQQQRLQAIDKEYAVEKAKLDKKLKELKDEMTNPQDSSFYLHYGQQAGIHGSYFEHNSEAYLKACRSAYFRDHQSALFRQLGDLRKQQKEKTMAVLTLEQRTKWTDYYRDIQNK